MRREIAAIPIAVGGVSACVAGVFFVMGGLHALLAVSAILRHD
jgi:hypothetical protein